MTIDTVIFDYDGTLTRENQQVKEEFLRCGRIAVREVVDPKLGDELIDEMLEASRTEFGNSFARLAKAGYDEERLHHINQSNKNPKVLKPNLQDIAAIRRLYMSGIQMLIVSHGDLSWVNPGLKEMQLKPYFPDNMIVTTEMIGHLKKQKGPEAYIKAFRYLGIPLPYPGHAAVVEDKGINLRYVREPLGWQRHLLDREKSNTEDLTHVDAKHSSLRSVSDFIINYNQQFALKASPQQIFV